MNQPQDLTLQQCQDLLAEGKLLVRRLQAAVTVMEAQYKPLRPDGHSWRVLSATAAHFEIGVEAIRRRGNVSLLCRPRHVAMYVLKNTSKLSYPQIGKLFCGMHHSSVVYAVKKLSRERLKDQALDAAVKLIIAVVQREAANSKGTKCQSSQFAA